MKITNDMSIFGWKVLDKKYGEVRDDRDTLNFNSYETEILNAIEKLLKNEKYVRNIDGIRVSIEFSEDHNSIIAKAFDEYNKCVENDIYNKKDYNDLYVVAEEVIDLWFPRETEEEGYF